MTIVKKIGGNLLEMFYPSVCEACDESLMQGEEVICTKCRYDIAKTNFAEENNNPVEEIFWGRENISSATAYCYYLKGGVMKPLLHKLKYRSKPEIGVELGKMLGGTLLNNSKYADLDFVIPLPLHPKRFHTRGYNQSEKIAQGICEVVDKTIETNNLYRSIETKTQTKKNRFQRWENVSDIFQLKKSESLKNKHVLLVDDVITTGATLEAATKTLNSVEGIKVSIATVAFAKEI